jgi:KipI family sensor histidine kinase inhibitor
MSSTPIEITALADSAFLIRVGDQPSISRERSGIVTALANRLLDCSLPGVIEIVPAYTTILIQFDLLTADPAEIERAIQAEALELSEEMIHPARRVTIPVCYGGAFGPDLAEVAALKHRTENEVIALHSGADYFVACMGFSPGWAYLLGLAEELNIPRRSTPRVRVPAGSVAIGGGQTGVYPMPTPGGWWLLGQTPARLFDPRLDDPFVLRPGDSVRFNPIDTSTYAELDHLAGIGEPVVRVELTDGD